MILNWFLVPMGLICAIRMNGKNEYGALTLTDFVTMMRAQGSSYAIPSQECDAISTNQSTQVRKMKMPPFNECVKAKHGHEHLYSVSESYDSPTPIIVFFLLLSRQIESKSK